MAWQLAELNIAQFIRPQADSINRDFFDNVDKVNAIAEQHRGFVWRLVDDCGDGAKIFGKDALINMSKWQDIESLIDFVYKNPQHKTIMSRRREWFAHLEFSIVLWWVDADTIPTLDQANQRLVHLKQNGPSVHAFTFIKRFDAPA